MYFNSQVWLGDLSAGAWTSVADHDLAGAMGRVHSLRMDDRGHVWIQVLNSLHEFDPGTGAIRSQWLPISPTIQNSIPPGLPEEAERYYRKSDTQLVMSIRSALGMRQQLCDLKGKPGSSPNRFVPVSRLSDQIVDIEPDGGFLWVLCQHQLLLYHPASHKYVGGYSLEKAGDPSALVCDGGNVWLSVLRSDYLHTGSHRNDEWSLVKLNASALKSIPPDRWLPDTTAGQELAARRATLTEPERSLYDFFTGDDASVVRELGNAEMAGLSAQSLFILTMADAELGQAESAARFKNELDTRFAGSVFTRALKKPEPHPIPAASLNNRRYPPP